jgi:hypothetical protein
MKPGQVNRLARDELTQRLQFDRGLVLVACLQPEGGVLEAVEQRAEVVANEQAQCSPSASR